MTNEYQTQSQDAPNVPERNIWAKTFAAILAAGAISAFSITGSYLLVTQMQPASLQSNTSTAEYCGEEKDGDSPKGAVYKCGEDKEGGGEGFIDV